MLPILLPRIPFDLNAFFPPQSAKTKLQDLRALPPFSVLPFLYLLDLCHRAALVSLAVLLFSSRLLVSQAQEGFRVAFALALPLAVVAVVAVVALAFQYSSRPFHLPVVRWLKEFLF